MHIQRTIITLSSRPEPEVPSDGTKGEAERPSLMRTYYVYILTNYTRTVLYIGLTDNLEVRLQSHRESSEPGFTNTYKCRHLIYYEEFQYVYEALEREKQLKRWRRSKKRVAYRSIQPYLV